MYQIKRHRILVLKNAGLLLGFFLFFSSIPLSAQNKALSDSLETIYVEGNYMPNEELSILRKLAYSHPDPDQALVYSEKLLERAKKLDSVTFIIAALQQKGNAYKLKGDVTKALKNYFEGVEIAKQENKNIQLGNLYTTIADVYSVVDNRQNTIQYYKMAVNILEKGKDSVSYASVLENLGDEYNILAKPDSALLFFKQSGAIWKALNHKTGMAFNLGNVGLVYAQKGENSAAEKNISEAIEMLGELGNYYPICVYLTYMADIYVEKGDLNSAFFYTTRSLELAKRYGLKEQISDAYLKLSELYERMGDMTKSLQYYKSHIHYKDSVHNITAVQQMANLEMSKKQIELDLFTQRTKTRGVINIATLVALILIGLLAFGLYRRNNFIKRTNKIIKEEKDRSESLLLNILPVETAMELKENGKVVAKKFDSVTVMFTDFKGFTHFSEHLAPEKLVESIGFYFSKFDTIMEKYGLEKIKTMGDAYMCAGGLPYATKDHAKKMLLAAFEILEFVALAKKEKIEGDTRFDIRIGINTGPIVAGVVGSKKFSYDIWGDTVNVAARMETMSEPGRINIGENTFILIQKDFDCEPRGQFHVKNRGLMEMYFVNGQSKLANVNT